MAADGIAQPIQRALLRLWLALIEQTEPSPRTLIAEVGMTAAAPVESDRRAAIGRTRPFHRRGANRLVPVLDRLTVDVELDTQRLPIEGRRCQAETELGLVGARGEVHPANRLRRFESVQQRFRRRQRPGFAGLPVPRSGLGIHQVGEMGLIKGVEEAPITEHVTKVRNRYVLLAVGVERVA